MNKRVIIFKNMITPYTNCLYNYLSEQGMDLVVLSCIDQEPNRFWKGTIQKSRYPHHILPGWTAKLSPSRYIHMNTGIVTALKQLAPDLLVIGGFYPSMLIAAMWAVAAKVPLALSTDGWRRTMPDTIYHRIVRPFVLNRCRAITCAGKKGFDYFREQGVPEERLFVVPLVPAWNPPDSIPAFADRPYHLLWVAHMNEEVKNISFFIHVAVALKRRIPNLAVRLVGSGNAQEQALTQLRNADITFRHDVFVHWAEMADVYGSARVLLLPSLWEAWGLVCTEAIQCGVPCIVSPFVGAADDAVISGLNGYVCPLEVERWVATAERLVTDIDQWAIFSQNARQEGCKISLTASATAFRDMAERILS